MWAEIAAFCTAKGYTLTVYVDDVTISGAKVPVADVWHVRRMIHRTGLRYHKLKHYVDRPAEITGVVVRDGKVVVPNRQRLKHRKPVIPRLFWYMSLVGSAMTLSYFVFSHKQDAVGIVQNLFPAFTAAYSLYLDIRHRGWHRDRATH